MKYSIIVVTYNREYYIKKCLDSIVNQTTKNFNLIIVDDGSTDETKKIVKSYQKKHKYIEYYYKNNTGVADSRNFGISKVNTPYFLFVDSDDYITPNLMETIEKYDHYDILSFKSFKISEDGAIIERMKKADFKIVDGKSFFKFSAHYKMDFIYPWGYIYNTKFWIEHELQYPRGYILEDSIITPIALINAEKVISIDYYGYYYVQTKKSIMRTNKEEEINYKTKSILFGYDYMANYIENFKCDKKFKTIFFDFIANLILWYGTTLPVSHLKNFCKELSKRNVTDNLLNWCKTVDFKIKLCKFSYKTYFLIYRFIKF